MQRKTKFFLILFVFLIFNISVVCAGEVNSTQTADSVNNNSEIISNDDFTDSIDSNNSQEQSGENTTESDEITKTSPVISIKSASLKSKDTLTINLKNASGSPLKGKKINVALNKKTYFLKTNSLGTANLKINLAAKTYKITISFEEDENYKSKIKNFNLKVSKLSTYILPSANFLKKGNLLYFYLYDQRKDPVSGKKLSLRFKGKTYTKTTNKWGRIDIRINKYPSKYSIYAKFGGDKQYKATSKKLTFNVVESMSFNIGNSKLLTGGYLRIYLKAPTKSEISKKTVKITIGNKKFTKKTNSEGIVVIKPKLTANTYYVIAKIGKYMKYKRIKCFEGNFKDPLKESIPFKNGVPDIDVMPANYVMGDGDATYTVTKKQYMEVIKRDSYCLFLNNKLSKYVSFKTKSHPNTYHLLKREKWNVIERTIYIKLVYKNKYKYWPGEITESLKGRLYTYPEVRDVQETGYTCGPTSASVCSQVLKNYYCESYLAKNMHSTKKDGTSCSDMISFLEKKNFKCTYFYKSTFSSALKELKKGGCALIFHADNHYVAILDISKNGKKVLVSNSYGTYDNIPSNWVSVGYMNKKFSPLWDESLIIKLNYNLSKSVKKSVNSFYSSMGPNWMRHNTHQKMGLT